MAEFGVVVSWCLTCDTLDITRSRDELLESLRGHHEHKGGIGGGPHVVTAADLAVVLPEHFRTVYWDRKVAEFCEREGLPT